MPAYEVVFKKVDSQTVAAIRDVIPTYSDVGRLFGEVLAHLGQHGARPAGPALAIYYDAEYRERDVDVEVAIPVSTLLTGNERVTIRELPGAESMACVAHQGSYDTIGQAYTALMTWIEANGYNIAGPSREVYLRGPESGGDPASYVTEVQFPVKKA